MAKGHRQMILLVCTECKEKNYITKKNKINTTEKLEIKKFCKKCKKHTLHKESSKLK